MLRKIVAPAAAGLLVAAGLIPGALAAGSGPVPRYYTYAAPSGVGDGAGEPSIGYDLRTGKVMFIAGLQTLRVTFPDKAASPAPASGDALWEDVSALNTNKKTLDPILHTNPPTGRTFVSQTTAGEGEEFLYAYSDDDGATWSQVTVGPPNGGLDHQTIGSGPYPATLPPGVSPSWPASGAKQAVYYCSQDLLNAAPAWCARSDDGGATWNNGFPTSANNCISSHGHLKVSPDGTVYLPAKACGTNPGMHVSTDAGRTWTARRIAGATADTQVDPSLAITANETVYDCWVAIDKHPHVAVSHDHGQTWSNDADIGASVGVVQAVFTEAVAGDNDRAACAFLGTNNGGDRNASTFPGVWYPYVATTYDGGQSWVTVNVTPGDPAQGIGGLCTNGTTCSGTNRNLLDFNEVTLDDRGYVLFGYADGCTGACVRNPAFNGYAAKATISRQVAGRPLYAAFDPVEPAAPDAPFLSGIRTVERTTLTWRVPDDGAAAITRYNIYRGTSAGSLQRISSVTGQPRFEDITVDPAVATYYYKVAAVNAVGEGTASNVVALAQVAIPPEETSCALPGITLAVNQAGHSANGVPPAPATAIQRLSVAELPSDPDQLVITLKVQSLTPVPPADTYWLVLYQTNKYIAMDTAGPDATQVPPYVRFRYGTYTAGTAGLLTLTDQGALDAKSTWNADGTITLYAPKARFGNPVAGSVITPFEARTRQGHTSVPSIDTIGPGDYTLRGLAVCMNQTPPVASLAASVQAGSSPLDVAFDAGASTDADQGPGTAGDTVASYIFNFGDGTEEITQASPFISHTYSVAGDFGARLRVVDSRGKLSSNTALQVITVTDHDTVPDAFGFPTRTGVPTGAWIASAPATITGIDAPSPVGIAAGGQYSVNGGAYTNQPGTVQAGDAVTVRTQSADAASTERTTTLTIGGVGGTFTLVTGTADRTPDPIDFYTVIRVAPGALIESNVVIPTGYDTAAVITPGAGQEYRVDGGTWTSAKGLLRPGQSLQVRHTSSAVHLGTRRTVINVGGALGVFLTRTQ